MRRPVMRRLVMSSTRCGPPWHAVTAVARIVALLRQPKTYC